MTSTTVKVPFVDLSLQHHPIHSRLEQAMLEVVRQGDFILGQALTEFETAFAQACGVEYGVGVASGTSAIALGLQACGIGVGDEVLIPTNTFIATVIGALQAGATPILVDCDPHTALIDLEAAAQAVTSRTKAVIPVHLYGQMVSPRQLLDFADTYNLLVFEDAAQAHLAYREGFRSGSVGTAAAFSFYPSKNLGAFGNGGMLVTGDEALAKKVRSLRNYGAPQKYFHTEPGTNSRLDTIQAAVLKVKLPYLPQWNEARYRAAQQYDRSLKLTQHFLSAIENQSGSGHVYHLYVVQLHPERDRQVIQEQLASRGIQTGIHYPVPCHLQPAYKYLGYRLGDFPCAEALSNRIFSLPMYPGISDHQIQFVCEQLSLLSDSFLGCQNQTIV
ncbi:MAG: DegT/DnrJ/EryC1/StrS family aminotransferase [Cyanophyceae cyanobacterium]